MKSQSLLSFIGIISLGYPIYMAMEASFLIGNMAELPEINSAIVSYQLSLWVCWVVLAGLAIYYKWTEQRNLFFLFCYFFIVIGFGLLGYFLQWRANLYEITTGFQDSYTFGVVAGLQRIILAAILTLFLQFSVKIFETKWHRR